MAYDINLTELKKIETNGLEYSSLLINFKGKDVNTDLVNTLRRCMLNNIPMYAFPSECIQIEKNTSVFNNDQMKIRLTQLPVFNTHLDLSYLENQYFLNVNYSDADRPKHPLEKNIELYLSASNDTDDVKYFTTNDIVYYEDNNKVENKYNQEHPILLIKLRPGELFKCKMKAVLGTGETNAIWSGAGMSHHNIISDNEFNLYVESQGQFDEYELLWKAARFMQYKMKDLKTLILSKYTTEKPSKIVEIILDDESHTTGNLLIRFLQDRSDVSFAGLGKRNELVKQIVIRVEYKTISENPIKPIMASMDEVVRVMEYVEKQVYDIGKKYINSGKSDSNTSAPKKKSKSKHK